EFGIFREGDRLVAYENHCPHDGGPVCQGKVIPRVEEELAPDQTSRGLRFSKKRNIVCPWHGWEFDIESGRHCGDPKYRLRPVGGEWERAEKAGSMGTTRRHPKIGSRAVLRDYSLMTDSRLELSIALSDNERTRPLIEGRVVPQGIKLVPTMVHPSEMFWRQL